MIPMTSLTMKETMLAEYDEEGNHYFCLIMIFRSGSDREQLADMKVSGVNLKQRNLTGLDSLEHWGNAYLETN